MLVLMPMQDAGRLDRLQYAHAGGRGQTRTSGGVTHAEAHPQRAAVNGTA